MQLTQVGVGFRQLKPVNQQYTGNKLPSVGTKTLMFGGSVKELPQDEINNRILLALYLKAYDGQLAYDKVVQQDRVGFEEPKYKQTFPLDRDGYGRVYKYFEVADAVYDLSPQEAPTQQQDYYDWAPGLLKGYKQLLEQNLVHYRHQTGDYAHFQSYGLTPKGYAQAAQIAMTVAKRSDGSVKISDANRRFLLKAEQLNRTLTDLTKGEDSKLRSHLLNWALSHTISQAE